MDLKQEPPTGSVVAIDWGQDHQEVWVSNRANIGNWYTPDIPLSFPPGAPHPAWDDVLRRAEGRTLTLLAAGDADVYTAGSDAGVTTTETLIGRAVGEARVARTAGGTR